MSTHDGSMPRDSSTLRYKFVEVAPVTDESLERTVNQWVARGWHLEGIRFVTSEASRRPAMAFVSFVRERIDEGEGDEPIGAASAE